MVFATDPDNIFYETVSDPGYLERSPSRISKNPDLILPFHVGLRILPVTAARMFVTSETNMLLSDECGILILGSCRGFRYLIITILRHQRCADIRRTQKFPVCLSDELIVWFKNLFHDNAKDSVLQKNHF